MSMTAAASGFSSAHGPGRPNGYYPSPYFDIAQTYIPRTTRELYKWLEYYATQHPIVAPLIAKMSTYAVTEVMFGDQDEEVVAQYRTALRKLSTRQREVEINLDRNTFGDGYASLLVKFIKRYTCGACKHSGSLRDLEATESRIIVEGQELVLSPCPKCDEYAPTKLWDQPLVAHPDSLYIKRWSPYTIDPQTNEFTGETDYFYTPSASLQNKVRLGSLRALAATPQSIIEAILRRRRVVIKSREIFRFTRPSPSRQEGVQYGAPLAAPALKLLFLVQILMKSQEAVALDHIVPLRTLYPMATSPNGDPLANLDLKKWMATTQEELAKWRRDPNYVMVLPFPVGETQIGGQGRAYLLHQELRVYNDMSVTSMGVPTSFHFGEAQYSGANVNMKALEVEFLGNREDLQGFLEFVCNKLAAFLGLPPVKPKLRPFKMADDLQRMSMDLQLVSQQIMSPQTFCEKYDLNYEDETDRVSEHIAATKEHQVSQAKAQAEAQAEGQRIMQERMPQPAMGPEAGQPPGPGAASQPEGGGGAPPAGPGPQQGASPPPDQTTAPDVNGRMQEATMIAQQLLQQPQNVQQQQLSALQAQDPNLHGLVASAMMNNTTDMRPAPEQLPPRRQ